MIAKSNRAFRCDKTIDVCNTASTNNNSRYATMAFKSTSIDAWTGGYRPLIFDIHETLPDIYIYITIKENPSGNRIGWRLTSKVEWLRLVVAGRLRHQFQNVSLVHWPVRRVLHLVVIKQRHRSVNHRCSINSCYLS